MSEFKCVPVNATRDMVKEAMKFIRHMPTVSHDRLEVAINAAIAAAPTQPSPAESDNSEGKWRDLALQFDGHRMQAIGWLKVAAERLPDHVSAPIKEFLKSPPLPAQKVLEDRIASISIAEFDKESVRNAALDECVALCEREAEKSGITREEMFQTQYIGNEIHALKTASASEVDGNESDPSHPAHPSDSRTEFSDTEKS